MNWYFYRIWIPLQILTMLVFIGVFMDVISINWWMVACSFFLIGPVGIGVGYHRLFSHRSFETWRPIEIALAILGTLAAYAPLLFWSAIHQQHHLVSDSKEDPSSPTQFGFWESFLFYRMRESSLRKVHIKNYCVRRILTDRILLNISKHFSKIVWGLAIVLGFINLEWLASLFVLPVFIEHLRSNVISSLSHMNIPLSYRNHDTIDDSQNNILLGYLSFGFAWHNNHHHEAKSPSLHQRWWELDIEGIIAGLLEKPKKNAKASNR